MAPRIRLCISSLLVIVVGSTIPSHAGFPKGTITGLGAIELQCALPSWPTAGSHTTCSGLASASWLGMDQRYAVSTIGQPYSAQGVAEVSTIGTISYNETCIANEPLLGFGQGVLKIGPGPAFAILDDRGTPDFGAYATVPIHWQRQGAWTVLSVGKFTGKGSNTEIHLSDGRVVQDTLGELGVGPWIPASWPGLCTSPAPLAILWPIALAAVA